MSAIYRKHPLTAGRIVDGVAFVVTADDNRLHSLTPTGSLVWDLCGPGVTVDAAAEELTKKFAVDLETARADIAALLADLVKRGILTVEGS